MPCASCGHPTPPGEARCPHCDAPAVAATPGGSAAPGPETMVPAPAAPPPPEPGRLSADSRLGSRYRIVRLLGQGGMGAVYLARDLELGRDVALKVVAPHLAGDPELLERFRREVQLSSEVTHANVLRVFDLGTADGVVFLTMQYIEGRTLADLLRVERPLPVDRAVALFRQIGEGLDAAHERGVLHRDLKPDNVMVDVAGHAFLTDFGLATTGAVSRMTRAGAVLGTPHYMSPEQVKGQAVDARSEIFSLGVLLYEMLAGVLPYDGDTIFEVMMRRTRAPPRPVRELNDEVSPALQRVLDRCLAIDPRQRYGSVKELLADLEAGAPRAGRPRLAGRPGWRRVAAAAGLALGLAALAGGAWWQWSRGSGEPLQIAVADFVDKTGDSGLEGLSSLLITSLEQSDRLEVLPRSRMRDVLRLAGVDLVDRIDETMGRRLGKLAGVRALILATLHRFGEVYALEVSAVDPTTDKRLFAVTEQGRGKESLPDMLDRVSDKVRRNLHDRSPAFRSKPVKLAEVTTPNLDAWQAYFRGMECTEKLVLAGSYGDCLADFQKAVRIDPGFALAHFQIAYLFFWQGRSRADQRAALEPALRDESRIPPRDRLRIQGWAAFLAGKDAEAKALLGQAARAAPDDKFTWYLAGEIPFHRDEFAEAMPYFQRASELDPTWLANTQHLVYALGPLGRTAELRALVERLDALGAKPGALVGACYARLWFDAEKAIAGCERGIQAGAGDGGSEFLAIARLNVGPRRELEALLRKMAAGSKPLAFEWYMTLLLRGQEGRWPEVRRLALEAGDPIDSWFHGVHAELLIGLQDRGRAWKSALRALEIDPNSVSNLAVHFAYMGDLAHAAELAAYLPAGSPRVDAYRAVVQWRQGDLAGAIDLLRPLADRSPLSVDPAIPFPAFLLGEALSEAGRDREAVPLLRRFVAMPLHYPSWTLPRALYFMARSQERLGDVAAARETVQRLLLLWKDAAPEQPLRAEARALGLRLGAR